jgi:hypothetical protein
MSALVKVTIMIVLCEGHHYDVLCAGYHSGFFLVESLSWRYQEYCVEVAIMTVLANVPINFALAISLMNSLVEVTIMHDNPDRGNRPSEGHDHVIFVDITIMIVL